MRFTFQRQGCAGFTRTDLVVLVVIVVVVVGVVLLLPVFAGREYPARRIKCVSNLKQIGLAHRIYAYDHAGKFPFSHDFASNAAPSRVWQYLHSMSNELQNAKILVCPSDKERVKNVAEDFGPGKAGLRVPGKQDMAVSYFLGFSADEARPQAALAGDRNLSDSESGKPYSSHRSGLISVAGAVAWTTNIMVHDLQGNVALADGSVVQLAQPSLKKTMAAATGSSGTNANLFLFPQ